ncbi:MAG: hypothetical protein WCY19_05850 [Candidatus Gastranaerophilaceae bacterium]
MEIMKVTSANSSAQCRKGHPAFGMYVSMDDRTVGLFANKGGKKFADGFEKVVDKILNITLNGKPVLVHIKNLDKNNVNALAVSDGRVVNYKFSVNKKTSSIRGFMRVLDGIVKNLSGLSKY